MLLVSESGSEESVIDLVKQSIKHTGAEHIACGKRQPEHVVKMRSSLLLFLQRKQFRACLKPVHSRFLRQSHFSGTVWTGLYSVSISTWFTHRQ